MDIEELGQRIQTLEDVEAIKKLKARYCAAADERDEDAFVGCFTEDAIWDGGSFRTLRRGGGYSGLFPLYSENPGIRHPLRYESAD